jgi:hypothetical protein
MRCTKLILGMAVLVVLIGHQVASAQVIEGVDPGKTLPPLVTTDPAPLASAATPESSAPSLPVMYLPTDGPWYANHEMRLRTDGNLPGQLRAFDSAGNLSPVRARLFFLHNGKLVARAASEETGNFQVIGLDEGIYSVVVAGPEGLGAFAIRVLPKTENTPPPRVKSIAAENADGTVANPEADEPNQGLIMDVSLVPPPDFTLASQIINEQIPGFAGAPGLAGAGLPAGGALSSAAGAGVGGGGGGLGGALVAAGAAGGIGAAIAASNSGVASNPNP